MFDIVEGESICYEYFINNKITNREELRKRLKELPILGINQSFIEMMFSNFKKESLCKKEVPINKGGYKIICINDLHIPYQDDISLNLVVELIKKEQPDELVLNGDIIDCYWESTFIKDPGAKEFLQDECNKFYRIFSKLRKFIPNTKISYILGNHEDRIKNETWKNPAFYGVEALEIPKLLKFDKLNIDLYSVSRIVNDFEFTHGKLCSKHASYTAKLEFEDHSSQAGMSGHTHRMGCYSKTSRKSIASWYENGCLCTLEPQYIKGVANWQQGFSVIYQHDNHTHVCPVIIQDHQFVFNGELYN